MGVHNGCAGDAFIRHVCKSDALPATVRAFSTAPRLRDRNSACKLNRARIVGFGKRPPQPLSQPERSRQERQPSSSC